MPKATRTLVRFFNLEDDPDLIIVRPTTAYPAPEYGDGD